VIFMNFELNFWSSSGRFRFEPRFRTKPWQHYVWMCGCVDVWEP